MPMEHDTPPAIGQQDLAAFWEQRYAGSERIWSGRVNAALQAVVAPLKPGRALDLGCGEGGDSIWLAEHGWLVTGVDIAPSAIARAREAAVAHGIPSDRIDLQAANLATWGPTQRYDLVSACFLHSPVAFPRIEVLRRAAKAVAPRGHLLIVGHAAPPPWAHSFDEVRDNETVVHGAGLLRAADQLAELDLPAAAWSVLVCEDRQREATGPDGQRAVLEDAVLLLQANAD